MVNVQSRRGAQLADDLRRELRAREIETCDGADEKAVDCIVAAGGDGTFTRLIPSVMQLGVPLGIVPAGTFNELARTLDVPFDLAAACDTIAAGCTRAVDVGRVNGTFYFSEASIGISSRITRLQKPEDKQRFGLLAILGTALQAFGHSRPIHVEIEFDGTTRRFKTVQLTVANSHRFGGLFAVEDAAIDDGWLDVYSIEIDGFRQAFSVARAIFSGKRQSVPGLRTYRSNRFVVRTHRPHHIVADGEPAGKTPATFEVVPQALRIFVPHPPTA